MSANVNHERDYYSIDEAATKSNRTVDDLLHLGANNRLFIYALLPMLPLVKYCITDFPDDRLPFGNLMSTSGLVRMHTIDIATLEAGGEPECHFFDKVDFDTGQVCSYRVAKEGPGLPLDTFGRGSVIVRRENLQVRADDLEALPQNADTQVTPDADAQKTRSDSASKVASPTLAIFREMSNLNPDEVTLDFAAGESGGVILNISARRQSVRVALAEMDLFDRRKAEMNGQCVLLLGMATGRSVKNPDNAKSKQISRIRKLLKKHLGVNGAPFARYDAANGYTPFFKITDSRGAADERAKREAERKTVPLPENVGYNSKGDDADKWLEKHGKGQ